MVDAFIKLFSGYDGDFGIADMSKATLDSEKNKIKLLINKKYKGLFDFKNLNINTN